MKIKTIVAVDPDVKKSGVTVLDVASKSISTYAMPFPELIDFIYSFPDRESVRIAVEAGWLNLKSNFHGYYGSRGERIAKDVGANHETGRKIVEMCEHKEYSVSLVKPLEKRWKGPRGKITHAELESVLKGRRLALNKKRTNQDERDSILIAIHQYDRL
jgi:hypothetical protein